MTIFVKDIIDKVKKRIALFNKKKVRCKSFIRIESQITIEQLSILLSGYAGSNELASLESLEPFLIFLSDRWDNIQETDAIYPHSPESYANQSCCFLAQELAEILHEHYYFLLMPTLRLATDQSIQEIINLKLHEFVFADDGVTPIHVANCLDQANDHRTTTLFHPNHKTQLLSKNESSRVINHCSESIIYYDALIYRQNHAYDIDKDINKIADEYHHAIKNSRCVVKASYGEKGKQKLVNHFVNQIKNIKHLIGIMQTCFYSRREWYELLENMQDQDLLRIVLAGDSIIDCVQRDKFYIGDENHDKAFLFCILESYIRLRKQQGNVDLPITLLPNYAGKWFHQYGKPWFGGYSMEEKLEAANALRLFLVSDLPLDKLKISIDAKYLGPLFEGDLGVITQQIRVPGRSYFF